MKIELPNSWEGVTIEQFQALQKILAEKGDEYATNVAIISIMSGVPVDEIETYSLKTYAKCMRTLSFLSEQLLGEVQKVVEFGGFRYDVITDVYNLNGGQYITLMHLMKDPDKVIDQLHEIMAVFFSAEEEDLVGLEETTLRFGEAQRGRGGNASSTYDNCTTFVGFFFEQLSNVRKTYTGIFGTQSGEDKETSGAKVETFETKYGWLNVVNNLSNNDATKWGYFFALPLREFLNLISFQKAKQSHEYHQQKQNGVR
jgi:hypothetical protein